MLVAYGGAPRRQPGPSLELSVYMNFLRRSWKRVAGYGTNDSASTSTRGGTEALENKFTGLLIFSGIQRKVFENTL